MKLCQTCKDYRKCPLNPRNSTKSPCLNCQDYRKCPFGAGKEFYTYGEIRWCPYQVVFIIQNIPYLADGNWPPNPNGSSYTDPNIQTGFRDEAYYTKPGEILAELEARMRTTGSAGEALMDEVEQGLTDIDRLSRPARRVLFYVKGWRRKKVSFPQYLANERYKQKRHKGAK